MNFDDLHLFVEVAKEQSFSRTAAKLHMGQPTVSQKIAALESFLGQELFERHRRGVRLTPAGNVLLDYANRILLLSNEAVDAVKRVESQRILVRIASPSTANSYLLPPFITHLANAGHDVIMRDAHSHEVMQYILDGSADVGFVIDIPGQPGIRRVPLVSNPIICVAAPSHPLAIHALSGATISLSNLCSYRVVFYRFSFEYDSLVQIVRAACVNPKHQNLIETTPAESVKALLRSGDYLSFLPEKTVALELERGELQTIPLADLPVYSWNLAMVYRDRKILPPAATAALEAAQAIWRNVEDYRFRNSFAR